MTAYTLNLPSTQAERWMDKLSTRAEAESAPTKEGEFI